MKPSGSPWFGRGILIAAVLGILTTWNAVLIGASRVFFALARARMIPARFATVHPRHGSPVAAILLVGGLGRGGRRARRGVHRSDGQRGHGLFRCRLRAGVPLGAETASHATRRASSVPRTGRTDHGRPGLRGIPGVHRPGRVGSLRTRAQGSLSNGFLLLAAVVLGALFWIAARGYRGTVNESERPTPHPGVVDPGQRGCLRGYATTASTRGRGPRHSTEVDAMAPTQIPQRFVVTMIAPPENPVPYRIVASAADMNDIRSIIAAGI